MSEIPTNSFRMPTSDASKYLEQAAALMQIGNAQEAVPLYETALATLERIHGVDQPETAECLQELGEAYEAAFRLEDALRIHTRLLRLGERVLGKTNPNVVAMQFKLCQINEMLGRQVDALGYCQAALEAAKQCMAQDDPLSQQIIERYLFLTNAVQSAPQPQSQLQAQLDAQVQAQLALPMPVPVPMAIPEPIPGPEPIPVPQPIPLPTQPPLNSDEIVGQTAIGNMQDFARQMLQDMPGAPAAPDMVAPSPYGQSPSRPTNDYKSVLEAGFVNAQTMSQTSLNQAHFGGQPVGMSGSPPPPPPAYEPGGEGYNQGDLDDIRSGRRTNSGPFNENYNEFRANRPRRMTETDNKRVELARLAKVLAFPALGAITLLIVFLLTTFGHHGDKDVQSNNEAKAETSTAPAPRTTAPAAIAAAPTSGFYRTADGSKEIRLTKDDEALLVTTGSALQVPYSLIDKNFGGMLSAIAASAFEKQIWAEKRDFGLKTQDEVAYYIVNGAEAKVMTKMRQLAAYVQTYFFQNGEYPREVPKSMLGDFAFVNPLNGRGSPIAIRTLLSQTSDGADARGGLESGLEVGLAPGSDPNVNIHNPCTITCYAVVIAKPDENLEEKRATRFFIRGCDRDGNFISSGAAGRSYVVAADNNALANISSGATAAAARTAKNKPKVRGAKVIAPATKTPPAVKLDTKADNASAPPLNVPLEKPDKNTRLWLIVEPPLPMVLIHHGLPLILLMIAVLAFGRSRMVKDDPTGTSISSTRDHVAHFAQIASYILLGLAIILLVAQVTIFS
ncbi:MAG: tetratricopeptide repeat protein [Cyanobacteria bacterium SZAS LIN-3]|nr:tetratricopeptide repeat protein [Cyanobacteria bacterium SZAS LIN-3]